MCLHVIDLGWVEYVTLCYVISACTGRLICEIFVKIYSADSLQWPVCNYLLCNKKDSSHCKLTVITISVKIPLVVRLGSVVLVSSSCCFNRRSFVQQHRSRSTTRVIQKCDGTTGQFMSVNQPFACPVIVFTIGQTCSENANSVEPNEA